MSLQTWETRLGGTVRIHNGEVTLLDPEGVREHMPTLARTAALGSPREKAESQFLIRSIAQQYGAIPASIHPLYRARGRGDIPPTFTVPAMNLRALPFLAARQVFQVAMESNAAAIIFEIARSEMRYTQQRPGEYAAQILAAAVAEGYRGPVFLQGDHFQVAAKVYQQDPNKELTALQNLIVEALAAGFFQIDIDASTLVDLDRKTIQEQQRDNVEVTARLSAFVRQHQPEGITVALGGEIGEVGGYNTTVEELRVFMDGYLEAFGRLMPQAEGICKISVQTGTAHGGVVLPDGTLAQVQVDFERLRELSRVAREEYGLAGAVQHGASTLPLDLFDKFPQHEACEIHLATQFMNVLFDHLPGELREEMYAYLERHHAHERKPEWTDAQFYYKLRKKALGPFKAALWNLPESVLQEVAFVWKHHFRLLFSRLNIADTRDVVNRYVTAQPVPADPDFYLQAEGAQADTLGDETLAD